MLKILKWVGIVLVGLILVITIFLAGSIVVDFSVGGDRIFSVTNTAVPGLVGEPDVRAYVAKPEGDGPFPAVIMIHEFYGLNESIIGKAEGLASEGYLVIAPDTFRGSTTAWIPRAIYQVIRSDPAQVNRDLDAVFAWLQASPDVLADHIAVVGFCYGGRASLGFSLHNPGIAATVIFYGGPETDPEILKTLPGPVLGIFGGADQSIPLEDVRSFEVGLEQAGIPHEITVYDGQPHAFVTDIDSIQAGGVQAQAWDQMLKFLESNLKVGGSTRLDRESGDGLLPFEWRYYAWLVYEHAFGSASHTH